MSKIECNRCLTVQDADVYEVRIPSEVKDLSIYRFFILVIEKCKGCGGKKAEKRALTLEGKYLKYGKVKDSRINKYLLHAIDKFKKLPKVATEGSKSSRFFLYCNVYGQKQKCFANLSTLKLGLFEDKSLKHFMNNLPTQVGC